MTLNRLVLLAAAILIGATEMTSPVLKAQTPVFRSGVDMVSLHVTVTNQSPRCLTGYPPYWTGGWDGCPVHDLDESAFRIDEDGVRQTIALFHYSQVPVSISIVTDVRSSVNARATEVREAAAGLTGKLRAGDSSAVMPSSPNMVSRLLQRYSSTLTQLTGAIRREAIVFVTDGQSALEPDILLLARRSSAAVYVIVLMGEGRLDETREPVVSFRRLASTTGGRAFFPADGRRLPAVYRQIYEELSRQYTIGYTSSNTRRDGAWRSIAVHVDRPQTSARTRDGYFAPEP